MSGVILSIILSNKKTIKATLEYCKDKSICKNNKNVLSKKLLQLSGYKSFPSGFDTVGIYNELAELSYKKPSSEKMDTESLLKITENFKIIISRYGSQTLKNFMMANGIVIPEYSSKIDTIKRNLMVAKDKLQQIYIENPNLVSNAIALYPAVVSQYNASKKAVPRNTKSKKVSRK